MSEGSVPATADKRFGGCNLRVRETAIHGRFSGYNQIPLFEEDQEHTTFVTDRGAYCYTVISFGLKNAWATYQHLVDHMFKDLSGKTMEVCIDDMVVKSEQKESHFLDLQKTFDILRQYRMKLNPAKFLVSPKTGQPIGVYLDSTKDAVSAVLFVTDPYEKPVYFVSKSLTGPETRYKKIEKIALALFHVSRRLKPYFQGRHIDVYSEYPLKRILKRVDDSIRLAIWSNFLGAYEIKYETRPAEKGHALDALLAYFPVDNIETITEEEDEMLNKPTKSTTSQTGGESAMEVDTPEPLWTIFTDGSSNVGGDGVGSVILTPEGSRIEKATRLGFQASKNEAAIIGLKAVKLLDARNVKLVTDSMLVVNQFLGICRAKEERMALYLDHMRQLENEFDQFSIVQRPRLENRDTDALEYLSSAVETDTTRFVVVDFQELPSISDSHLVLALEHASGGERATTSAQEDINNNMDVHSPVIDDSSSLAENTSDRRQPYYVRYLTTSELPEDEHLASKVMKNSWRYSMIEGRLYRKSVALEQFLRCISAEEGEQILAEAHEGIFLEPFWRVQSRALSQGYFWPYM
ncbi:uncharacterized protein LOC113344381 [Papaver somniferum]|uniref:uncharacterized protein LOC113344381 n=1 Tax=Papaver somniferum TaxID=3469 RepID=UPI000E702061|nr:uncharacterized protein LOC113344381 [Papaver somniferum]